MYKGWIKCSENFQMMTGFSYKNKQKRHGKKYKYYDCVVTDIQLQGMKDNWEKFKEVDIEWDLEKTVNEAHDIKEGEVLLHLIGYNHYFFNRYFNLKHYSKLREWKTYNGLYYTSNGKYVSEGFKSDKVHIRDDCSVYDTLTEYIREDTKSHAYDEDKIDSQIQILLSTKDKLSNLNNSK